DATSNGCEDLSMRRISGAGRGTASRYEAMSTTDASDDDALVAPCAGTPSVPAVEPPGRSAMLTKTTTTRTTEATAAIRNRPSSGSPGSRGGSGVRGGVDTEGSPVGSGGLDGTVHGQ